MCLFMRDMEAGIRAFSERYSTALRPHDPATDPVSSVLEPAWDHRGAGVEMLQFDSSWLYAPEPRRMNPIINANLDLLRHPTSSAPPCGDIYWLRVYSPMRGLDIANFLNSTKDIHLHTIHIMPDSDLNEVAVTIPAVLGPNEVAKLVFRFLAAGVQASRSSGNNGAIDMGAWPEYILWPDNHLCLDYSHPHSPIFDIPVAT
jgi:hypothetical protein